MRKMFQSPTARGFTPRVPLPALHVGVRGPPHASAEPRAKAVAILAHAPYTCACAKILSEGTCLAVGRLGSARAPSEAARPRSAEAISQTGATCRRLRCAASAHHAAIISDHSR